MAKKVFIGVGHGGVDSGAVGYIVEKDVNLNMAKACRDYLEAHGVIVKMSRTKDENDDLREEIRECNAFDPDVACDIHNNSDKGDGFEAYYSIVGGLGKELAHNIEEEVKKIGQNSRGCKTRKNSNGTDYYGFIRQTKAPAVIVEGVFVDNKKDAAQADTLAEQKAFGEAYAKGILKTLGISTKPSKKPKPTTDKIRPGDKVKYSGYLYVDSDGKGKGSKVSGTYTVNIVNSKPYGIHLQNKGWAKKSACKKINSLTKESYYPKCASKYNSLVDALKSIGVNASFSNRKVIAKKNGIKLYVGTVAQNNKLISLLKNGKLKK